MGNWGEGLLDNDSALDAIGDILADVERGLVEPSKPAWTEKTAAVFCARLAIEVRLGHWFWDPADDAARAHAVRETIKKQRPLLDAVAPSSTAVFDALARGDRLADAPPLHALLRHPGARGFLQGLADTMVENVDDDLESQQSGAYLVVLQLLAQHVALPGKTLRHWLRRTREIAADMDEDDRDLIRPRIKAIKELVETLGGDEEDEDDESE